MIISKIPFFLVLFFSLTIPMVAPRLIWIAETRRTTGWMDYEGAASAGDMLSYSHIYYRVGRKTIWFNATGGLKRKHDEPMPVRYLPDDLTNARIGDFLGLWGDLLVYGGIPELILLISFLHPDVMPWGSRLRLTLKRPYIRLWSTHPN